MIAIISASCYFFFLVQYVLLNILNNIFDSLYSSVVYVYQDLGYVKTYLIDLRGNICNIFILSTHLVAQIFIPNYVVP